MLKTAALASGSSGNSYFIKNEDGLFIFDLGISFKRLKESLKNFSFKPEDISAVFISHEHSDHIRGLKTFIKYLPDIPIFVSAKTYFRIKEKFEDGAFVFFTPGDKLTFENSEIFLYEKYHDAIEPVFFKVSSENGIVSIITDFGSSNKEITKAVSESRILYLEFNYELSMLETGMYPEILKERIKSKLGHFSNCDASDLLKQYANGNLEHLIISHVSEKNNTYERAFESAKKIMEEKANIIIATQSLCSKLIEIS